MGNTVNTHAELTYPSDDADDDSRLRSELVPAMGRDGTTLKVPAHALPLESEVHLRVTTAAPALDLVNEVDLGWPADDGASNDEDEVEDETETGVDRPSARPTSHPSHRPTWRVPEAYAPPAKTGSARASQGSYSQVVGRRRSM